MHSNVGCTFKLHSLRHSGHANDLLSKSIGSNLAYWDKTKAQDLNESHLTHIKY